MRDGLHIVLSKRGYGRAIQMYEPNHLKRSKPLRRYNAASMIKPTTIADTSTIAAIVPLSTVRVDVGVTRFSSVTPKAKLAR